MSKESAILHLKKILNSWRLNRSKRLFIRLIIRELSEEPPKEIKINKEDLDIKKVCLNCAYLNPNVKRRYKCYTHLCPARNGLKLEDVKKLTKD